MSKHHQSDMSRIFMFFVLLFGSKEAKAVFPGSGIRLLINCRLLAPGAGLQCPKKRGSEWIGLRR